MISEPAAMRRATGAQPDVRSASVAAIQIIAVITMMVDHLGVVGVLGEWSRMVGRLALPLFVLMVAYNALVAPDPGRMLRRLGVLFVVSQPLWSLTVGDWSRLCILVTLSAVVALVWCWRCRDSAWSFGAFLLVMLVFLAVSPWVEYGAWPLLLVPVAVRPGLLTGLLALVWPFAQYGLSLYLPAALFALALVVVLVVPDLLRFPFNVPRLPRWVSRSFYPGHLAVLLPLTIGWW